ncbi:MAG: 3-dehydroquinate synthase [Coriobacteriia bacterium]|nr:3-dehydroquinate synthase [Coriobacteriia bacterium]
MSDAVRIQVATSSGPYPVHIGSGILDSCGLLVREHSAARTAAVVTDSNVQALLGIRVLESLEAARFRVVQVTVEPGEASKSWARAGEVLEALAAHGLDRGDIVVALGGGVIGDLAGFCAAVYMRGISYAQIPTTLLAQVDSSVGGKTAVDLAAGKNLAGAILQPCVVVADTDSPCTVSDLEWRSGLAEIAKSAVLDGEEFLSWLETHARDLADRDSETVKHAIQASVEFKARIVAADERETGVRECLNLGHTLGHAIEKVAGYGAVAHGLAVAEGMRFSSRLAARLEGASPEFVRRQEALLDALGLVELSSVYDSEKIRAAMSSDKKVRDGAIRFVLATSPGEHVVREVDSDVLREELREWMSERG